MAWFGFSSRSVEFCAIIPNPDGPKALGSYSDVHGAKDRVATVLLNTSTRCTVKLTQPSKTVVIFVGGESYTKDESSLRVDSKYPSSEP